MELILGSQSSARANLLKEHGIKFEQINPLDKQKKRYTLAFDV